MDRKIFKKYRLIFIAVVILLFVAILSYNRGIARKMLYWGSRNQDVRIVQNRLRQWGYYEGPASGIFGERTWRAVRSFQSRNGLRVDGVVGPETWAALGYNYSASASRNTTTAVNRGDELNQLARIIHAEARGEPYEGKVAVGAVMLNRVKDPAFPNTLSGVIYQPLAFESVANGQYMLAPNESSIRAARQALNGWDPTYGSVFFWNPGKKVNPWIWSRNTVRTIGNHIFAH
ncbi:MAG: spore cortex-lytic enzyme [Bacillota bacterium]